MCHLIIFSQELALELLPTHAGSEQMETFTAVVFLGCFEGYS